RDGDDLTYLWDFGNGTYTGNSTEVFADCESESSEAVQRRITLTVSDGALSDTQQITFNQACGFYQETEAIADFVWTARDNTVYFDGRGSTDAVYLAWDFGDGGTGSGLRPAHTYAQPGTYEVTLTAYGPDRPGVKTIEVTVSEATSSASSSSVASSDTTSSASSDSSSSV